MPDFGPNQSVVERFLDRIDLLGDDDLVRLTAAWRAGSDRKRRDAWRSASVAGARAKREAAFKRAQSAVVSWSNRRSPMFTDIGMLRPGDQMRADIGRAALPALVDAIGALVVRDVIPGDSFEELYGPFDSIDEDRRIP